VEERPKLAPGVISDTTIVPLRGPDAPFSKTRHVAVSLSDVTSTRDVPWSGTLPDRRTVDISKKVKVLLFRNFYQIRETPHVVTDLQYIL